MLDFLRQHVTGFAGLLLVGALVFMFAVSFGSQGDGWGKGQSEQIAASVEGEKISEATYNCAVNLSGGRQIAKGDAAYQELVSGVIDGLIERQLLLNWADEAGISASKDDALKSIVDGKMYVSRPLDTLAERSQTYGASFAADILIENGHRIRESFKDSKTKKFDADTFEKWVRNYIKTTEEVFVDEQRKEIIALRARQLLVSGVKVSEAEARDIYNRDADTVTISYLKLSASDFADEVTATPEAVQKWAQDNKDAVKQYYETNKYKYLNQEKKARAAHILVKLPENADDAAKAKAKTDIEAIQTRLTAGEDFGALAKQLSQDDATKTKGGDLGYVAEGVKEAALDKAIFSLKPGEVSSVIETKDGLHLVKLLNIREGNISLEEATTEIAENLYKENSSKEKAKTAAGNYLAKVKSGTAIDTVLPADSKLKVKSTRALNKTATSIPGVGPAKEIIEAAFKLTNEKPVVENVITINDDHFVVTLKERNVPSDEKFKEEKEAISKKLLALKKVSWLRDRIRTMKESAISKGEIDRKIAIAQAAPQADAKAKTDEEKSADKKDKNEKAADQKTKKENK